MSRLEEPGVTIRLGDWRTQRDAALPIRWEVFVEEQGVPPELEQDEADASAVHAVLYNGGDRPLGTGRLSAAGKIGRLAVLKPHRGRGHGDRLLHALMAEALRRGLDRVTLAAQIQAIPFYERHGFRAFGPEFDDAGLPHRRMAKEVTGP